MKKDQASNLREKFAQTFTNIEGSTNKGVRSIAFTSGKGGVGKTSIVVNLAIQLSQLGKKVFIIDADLGLANIDIMLNLSPQYTIEDVLTGKRNINDIIVEGPLGIHILPSSSGISEMQELNADQQMSMFKELSNLKAKYDYILIDTGAGITSNVLRFNAAADEICVITNTEPTAMTDAYALMKIMSTKYQIRNFSLIVNQSNIQEAKSVYGRLVKVLNQFLPVNLTLTGFIPRDLNIPRAIKKQAPLAMLLPSSPAIKMIKYIADHIDKNPGLPIEAPQKLTFWQKVSTWKK